MFDDGNVVDQASERIEHRLVLVGVEQRQVDPQDFKRPTHLGEGSRVQGNDLSFRGRREPFLRGCEVMAQGDDLSIKEIRVPAARDQRLLQPLDRALRPIHVALCSGAGLDEPICDRCPETFFSAIMFAATILFWL